MPFTTSHPAVVFPIKQLWPNHFSLTGLVAGAMAPDLLYFLADSTVWRGFSHSWTGLFLFCLPAGVVFSFAFHWLFKYQFIRNLPFGWDRKFSGLAVSTFCPNGLRWWAVLVWSVLLGTLTHFGWDSITHEHGEVAVAFPMLLQYIELFGYRMRVTDFLQHLSTLAGSIAVVAFLSKGFCVPPPRFRELPRRIDEKLLFWFGGMVFAVLYAGFVVWIYREYFPYLGSSPNRTFLLAVWSGFFWAVCGYGLAKRFMPSPLGEPGRAATGKRPR